MNKSQQITTLALSAILLSSTAFAELTKLHHAVCRGDFFEVVSIHLEDNPQWVFEQDDTNCTPLHYAASKGHAEITNQLLLHGAVIRVFDINHRSPIHNAAKNGHIDIVATLIAQTNLDTINARDNWNHSALDYARKKSCFEIIALLEQYESHSSP